MSVADSEGNINFNSHAHVERDKNAISRGKSAKNFNSHAHVERDYDAHHFWDLFDISTHTLTWSVTARIILLSGPNPISTHTLTWSVTCP